jgi:chromosome partitioning protein
VAKEGLVAKIIVWANHKGGVGKTTATANSSAALAERGARVLAVDLDPQGHLGEMFGIGANGRVRLEHVMLGNATAADAIVTVHERVDLLPCTEELAEAQFQVAADPNGAQRLRQVLEPLTDDYDYILLDSPPGIGFWSGMALLTAQWALIATLAEELPVLSSGKIADFIDRYAADANPALQLMGVVITQAKPKRWRLMQESSARFEADGLRELARIPKQEDAARTLRYQKPMFWLHPDGAFANGYRKVAEAIERETAKERP